MNSDFALWVYLSTTPLLWLTVTLAAWLIADALSARAHRHPLVNPVLVSIILISLVLNITATPYATFFEGAQFVHFLLGPATVAIAIPLIRHRQKIRDNLLPMVAALGVGSVTGVVSVLALGRLTGLPHEVLVSIAAKSVTAGVAMGVTEQLGGQPALTAVVVVSTGIFGAIIVTPMMNMLRVKDYAARGFAVGLSAHGIGTARAFTVDPLAGTFAGIAMGLNAIVTAFVVPVIAGWMH